MEQSDHERVVADMRLATVCPGRFRLRLGGIRDRFPQGSSWIRLDDPTGRFVGVLHLTQKYHYDKTLEAMFR